jgi:hypothetical protein
MTGLARNLEAAARDLARALYGVEPEAVCVELGGGRRITLPVGPAPWAPPPPLPPTAPLPSASGPWEPSADCREWRRGGQLAFSLSDNQAEIARRLWEARQAGRPEVSGEDLLRALPSGYATKVSDVFKSCHGWEALIASRRVGKGRYYRLTD